MVYIFIRLSWYVLRFFCTWSNLDVSVFLSRDMRFWHAGEVGLLLATIVIVAKLAAAASSDENLFDLNASNGEDWTLDAATGTDPYVDGGDTIALNSGISYEPLSEDIASANLPADNQQLFLNDSDDPQSNDLLLADLVADGKGGECSTSNMPGRKRRRNTMCSSSVGIVTSFPSQSILDASAFDSLYCPTASITIKSLFVCSSPDPRKTVYGYAVWTLYESTRGKQPFLLLFSILSCVSNESKVGFEMKKKIFVVHHPKHSPCNTQTHVYWPNRSWNQSNRHKRRRKLQRPQRIILLSRLDPNHFANRKFRRQQNVHWGDFNASPSQSRADG